jgi:hypothetical protein
MVKSERRSEDRMLPAMAVLLTVAVSACEPAGAAGDSPFIGEFAVEDERIAALPRQALHYRITHNDPERLASYLAEWIPTPVRRGSDISFSLDAYPVTQGPEVDGSHLASSFLIDYTEPSVQELRALIETRYGPRPSPGDLERFVYESIEDKNSARGFDVASVVAQSRTGDCSEHAVLLTALLRMYGYPARTVLGIFVSLQEPAKGYGHAWVEYRAESGWTGIDGTRIDDSVGMHYIPLGVIRDESIAYRLGIVGLLHGLSIDRIRVQ